MTVSSLCFQSETLTAASIFYTSRILTDNSCVLFLEYLLQSCCILPYELTLPLLIILEDQTIYLIIAEFSYILISLWYYLQINLKILWLWPMSIKVLRQVVLLNILTGWLAKYLRAIQLLTYLFPQLVIFIKRHHNKSMELLSIQNIVVQPVVIFA